MNKIFPIFRLGNKLCTISPRDLSLSAKTRFNLMVLKKRSPIRKKILGFTALLIVISLTGTLISLNQIKKFNNSIDAIAKSTLPLSRLLAQIQSDTEVYRHESERRLSKELWNDSGWLPKSTPVWIKEVVLDEITGLEELLAKSNLNKAEMSNWISGLKSSYQTINDLNAAIIKAITAGENSKASNLHSEWMAKLDEWSRDVRQGASLHEKIIQETFLKTQAQMRSLKTGLELILVVVILVSLLLLWMGEKALRPLGELTYWIRQIASSGVRKEDILDHEWIRRRDEMGDLGREFKQMAQSLIEREKLVDSQNQKLSEQYFLLKEMGELNHLILQSIKSFIILVDQNRVIQLCNLRASFWLGMPAEAIKGIQLESLSKFKNISWLLNQDEKLPIDDKKIEFFKVEDRIFGGRWYPLKNPMGKFSGGLLVLEDLTQEKEMERRLHEAEQLATVGRMSAQVAHEVRNPLHSIGLEAEIALEFAQKDPQLKGSIESILDSVARLEKITDNYLKLSKLSSGRNEVLELNQIIEHVLAMYTNELLAKSIVVDWKCFQSDLVVMGDPDLIEQAIGNLLRNSIQAFPLDQSYKEIRIHIYEKDKTVEINIEDNGPGVSPEIQQKLFTPFVTSKAQGTGLGLSFVKRVVEDFNGGIRYQAQSTGASFIIQFPGLSVRKENHEASFIN